MSLVYTLVLKDENSSDPYQIIGVFQDEETVDAVINEITEEMGDNPDVSFHVEQHDLV